MNKKEKIRKIKGWIKEGKIKITNEKARVFSVPNEVFILGITPRLINEVLKQTDRN